MIPQINTIIIGVCFGITSLYSEPIGYDQEKQQTIQNAKESEQMLQEHFNALVLHLQNNALTGDQAHDKYILTTIKQNQKDWLAYRYSTCQSKAMIEVYPSTSRLYTQIVNNCLSELDHARINYLNNLLKELSNVP